MAVRLLVAQYARAAVSAHRSSSLIPYQAPLPSGGGASFCQGDSCIYRKSGLQLSCLPASLSKFSVHSDKMPGNRLRNPQPIQLPLPSTPTILFGIRCPWCHTLEQFFQQHPDVLQLRDTAFVVLKVYYGSDNKNEQVLSRYSKLLGIPHFFVLDKDGNLIYSQHVVELQTNGEYNPGKMKDFLSKWSAPTASTANVESKTAAPPHR